MKEMEFLCTVVPFYPEGGGGAYAYTFSRVWR